MKTPRLTTQMVAEIGQCLRLGLNWNQTAKVVGVHRNTLQNWRKAAETAESGVLKTLHDVIEASKAGVIHQLTATVIEAATQETLTKRQEKETRDREGNPYTEITKTYEGANPQIALKALEKYYPEFWGKVDDGTDGTDTSGTDLTNKLIDAAGLLNTLATTAGTSDVSQPDGSTNDIEASGESD